jgi:uncharacterized protein
MLKPSRVFLLCVVVSLAVGFSVAGALLYRSFIGLDASAFPAGAWIQSTFAPSAPHAIGGLFWFGASLTALFAGTFVAVLVSVRTRGAETDPGRRGFLAGAAAGIAAGLAAAAAGGAAAAARAAFGIGNGGRGWARVGQGIQAEVEVTSPQLRESWKGAQIRSHRRLGRTGFEASDICLGSGRIKGEQGERIVRQLIDRGVNYIDTAPDYSASGSEQAIGRAIRGRRDQLFIATKFCTPLGHLPAGTPVPRYVEVVEQSLGRLGTDYVDLVHVHACDEIERLMDPNLHEAFDRLKESGKARFLGFSSHTPNLLQVADRAISSGRFDVMMPAYHHGIWPTLPETIARARSEQDMGVVAMKTLKGAKHRRVADLRGAEDAYSQAAFKWVLSNANVSCLVISFFEPQQVDEYLDASGRELAASDLSILERYDRAIAGTYCAPHCGACLDRCPESLPIHDVFRYRMYFEDYGFEKHGMELYARLGKDASVCATCAAPCTGSCPSGIPIGPRMRETHELLTLG